MRVMEAVLAVVGGASLGVAEDVVGGGYSGESLAGVWVGAVTVWVVAKGEGVKLSIDSPSTVSEVSLLFFCLLWMWMVVSG